MAALYRMNTIQYSPWSGPLYVIGFSLAHRVLNANSNSIAKVTYSIVTLKSYNYIHAIFCVYEYFKNVFYISNNQNTKYSCKSILNTITINSGESI